MRPPMPDPESHVAKLAARAHAPRERVAWMHEEDASRVISDQQKMDAIRSGGASASSVMHYSIRLSSWPDPAVEAKEAALRDLIDGVRSINRDTHHQVAVEGDEEPCFWQRKEWIDWILALADTAEGTLAAPLATVGAAAPAPTIDAAAADETTLGERLLFGLLSMKRERGLTDTQVADELEISRARWSNWKSRGAVAKDGFEIAMSLVSRLESHRPALQGDRMITPGALASPSQPDIPGPLFADSLNRRAAVEQDLLDVANGKRSLPDANQCRAWAMKLGVPVEWLNTKRAQNVNEFSAPSGNGQ